MKIDVKAKRSGNDVKGNQLKHNWKENRQALERESASFKKRNWQALKKVMSILKLLVNFVLVYALSSWE